MTTSFKSKLFLFFILIYFLAQGLYLIIHLKDRGRCPNGYVLVPLNSKYITKPFCIAVFEMKKGPADNPLSVPQGLPWILNKKESIEKCKALGYGYDLISNNQWQTVARNIEMTPSNWSSKIIGVGSINRGHSAQGQGALSVDNIWDPYDQTFYREQNARSFYYIDQEYGRGGEQKRTHVLSNGNIVWDFAGNVWEWIKDENGVDFGDPAFISQLQDVDSTKGRLSDAKKRTPKDQFGPSLSYLHLADKERGGLGYASLLRSSPLIARGGGYESGVQSGIFSVRMDLSPEKRSRLTGFRCIFQR